ncbi:MAG: HAD hydrolase-like protein [Methanobacteriales archaeon]|nr:HAD hydrolase-like protein [Methanobacteriales archaeon]
MERKGTLTLFDIDGTLVRGARCHYQAFVQAVDKYYQIREDISGINYAGKTDPQILREVLELGGIGENAIQKDFQACLKYMVGYYREHVHRENIMVLTGVEELLVQLQKEDVLLGLTTGNLEPIAYAKLGRVGLDNYFAFGGFGSDSEERPGLVKKALERARDLHHYQGDRIFVIGDTPRDVAAAKPFQLYTVAVATGSYSSQELSGCGADYVLEDLKDVDQVLEIINP